jgi:hypothetical protein
LLDHIFSYFAVLLQLQSLSLPCNKLGQIIPTANENIFKVDIPKSPCRTTIQNIIDERHYLSRKFSLLLALHYWLPTLFL